MWDLKHSRPGPPVLTNLNLNLTSESESDSPEPKMLKKGIREPEKMPDEFQS